MRKIWTSISLTAIVAIAIGFGVSKYNSTNANENLKVYTMQEALSDDLFSADFNVEEKSLDIQKENPLGAPIRIAISEEDEQELIDAMEQWELTEYDYNSSAENISAPMDYYLYLTINTGYQFFMSLEGKRLRIASEGVEATYNIQNGDEFFRLFKSVIPKTSAGQ